MNREQTKDKLIELEIEADRLGGKFFNLRGANLCWANLREANLYEANLREANLYEADLCGADLCGANLREANLYEANLRGANLRGADLCGADLCGANLRGATWLPTYQKWTVAWNSNGVVSIGCKTKTIEEWDAWFAGDEEYSTPRGTADFEWIEAAYQHAKRMYEIYVKYENTENAQDGQK